MLTLLGGFPTGPYTKHASKPFTPRRDQQEIYLYNIQKQQSNEEENIN